MSALALAAIRRLPPAAARPTRVTSSARGGAAPCCTRWCASPAASSASQASPNELVLKRRADEIAASLKQLEVENAELRAQLRVQNSLSRQRNELLTRSLEAAAKERELFQEQLVSLTRDFHALAEKFYAENLGWGARVQRKGVEGKGGQSRMAFRPDVEYAMKQPTHVCELAHQSLAELAMLGNHCARRERLLREVMCVDGISWGQAHEVLNKLDQFNERYYWIETMPYRLGITTAFISGIASIVLVFWAPVAEWYATEVAGEQLPEGVKEIGELTMNQVGTWTWSWMEPMIGTASFVLLCCQFVRAQALKMNMRTYSEQVLQWRASRIAKAFPRYDVSMLRAWAKHMPTCGLHFFPTYERNFRQKGPASGL